MMDIHALGQSHQPNTPRTHDGQGRLIKPPEALQCRKCLQVWPCDITQLISIILGRAA